MARLEARLPGEVHALLKRAAELQGRTLTDFVVTSASDQLLIARALLDPPPPAPALIRAAKRHRDLVKPA
jgi:hypothetical protein